MTSSAYTVHYAALFSFYLCINFILFLIVKNDELNIFIPKINNTKLRYVERIARVDLQSSRNKKFNSAFTDICIKYNVSAALTKSHFLYDEEHKMMYCWIRKIASTSFTKLFFDMKSRRIADNYNKEINVLMPRSPKMLDEIIKDESIFKFIVVRHPFERIVSTYRDRIEDNSKYTAQAWIFAKQIFQLTRPDLMKGNYTTGNSMHQIFDEQKRLKLVPSFNEFIKWLVRQPPTKYDPHWATFADHCSLCNIKYDKIFHLDNNQISEMDLLSSKIGLLNNTQIIFSKLKTTKNGPTNFKRACHYFKDISKKLIVQLYGRYKIDFEMFRFQYKTYFKCSSNYNK